MRLLSTQTWTTTLKSAEQRSPPLPATRLLNRATISAATLAGIIFAIDLAAPRAAGVGMLYVLPLLVGTLEGPPRFQFVAASVVSVLTVLGGAPVHSDGDFANLAPPLPPPMPDWSPVRTYGGYQKRADAEPARKYAFAAACGCATACGVHGHAHAGAWGANLPMSDEKSFWGAPGCSCWAF